MPLNKKKKNKRNRTPVSPTKKARIFYRDQFMCFICGTKVSQAHSLERKRATIDHVIPRSRGGGNGDRNLQTACSRCNNRKGDTELFTFYKELELEIRGWSSPRNPPYKEVNPVSILFRRIREWLLSF